MFPLLTDEINNLYIGYHTNYKMFLVIRCYNLQIDVC